MSKHFIINRSDASGYHRHFREPAFFGDIMDEEQYKEFLKETYETHLSDKNSIGVDGVSSAQFSENLDEEIDIIVRKVSKGTYHFSLYKEKLILKGRSSHPRAISIPTNRDKLILKALHVDLSHAYKDQLESDSIHHKIKNIKRHFDCGRYNSFIKLDIESFFPNIDHDILFAQLERKVTDKEGLSLIKKAVQQSTVSMTDSDRSKQTNIKGVPQGLSVSGLLASIYLSDIDDKHKSVSGYEYYRFVDDILVLCHEPDNETIRQTIKSDFESLNLKIHDFKEGSQKSSYGFVSDGMQFLGYQFKGQLISVRPSSLDKIYNGINRVFLKFHKYAEDEDLDYLYKRLNLKITGCFIDEKQYGWLYFFSFINDKKLLFKLDAHVKRACRRFKVPYDEKIIKKFSRTYYELIKAGKSNYIPVFKSKKQLKQLKKSEHKKLTQEEKDYITGEILSDIESDIEFY